MRARAGILILWALRAALAGEGTLVKRLSYAPRGCPSKFHCLLPDADAGAAVSSWRDRDPGRSCILAGSGALPSLDRQKQAVCKEIHGLGRVVALRGGCDSGELQQMGSSTASSRASRPGGGGRSGRASPAENDVSAGGDDANGDVSMDAGGMGPSRNLGHCRRRGRGGLGERVAGPPARLAGRPSRTSWSWRPKRATMTTTGSTRCRPHPRARTPPPRHGSARRRRRPRPPRPPDARAPAAPAQVAGDISGAEDSGALRARAEAEAAAGGRRAAAPRALPRDPHQVSSAAARARRAARAPRVGAVAGAGLAGGRAPRGPPPPPPPPVLSGPRRVPHPVLIGHAASLTPY